MKLRLALAAVIAASLAAGASVWAYAAAQPNTTTGVISACYNTTTGALRVDTPACNTTTESPLSWQSGAVKLRADIATGAPDRQLMAKDGEKLILSCSISPGGVWIANLDLAPTTATNANGSYMRSDESQAVFPEVLGMTVTAGTRATIVTADRGGGGFGRDEGEFVLDTPSHVVSVVFHLVANAVSSRCQVTGTANVT